MPTRRDTKPVVYVATRPSFVGVALAFSVSLSCLLTCAESTPEVRVATRPVAPYAGRAVELFDDGIEPVTVGYTVNDVPAPDADRILRERIEAADGVVRARVVTLTSRESERGWLLGLRPLETLAGAAPPGGDVTLRVDAADHAGGVLRAFEGRIVGMTVVAFLRAFAHEVDGRELHFHIAPDSAAELAAVRAATLLGEIH